MSWLKEKPYYKKIWLRTAKSGTSIGRRRLVKYIWNKQLKESQKLIMQEEEEEEEEEEWKK